MTDQPTLTAGGRQAPARLVLVRHGQSVGNVADQAAHDQDAERLEIETRDADTPLSEDGEEQSRALGRWIASLPEDQRPEVVLSSPYLRAHRTCELAMEAAGLELGILADERLRERDLGVLDGFTRRGIEINYPDEAARRARVGKLYYRPAGGESWCDVALRIRSLVRDIASEHDGKRVWVFTHQAVIMAFRLVLESLDEKTLLGIEAEQPLPNTSVTSYVTGDQGALELESYARTEHLDVHDAPETAEPEKATKA